jgi:predicted patatin/cPLA2 family phospholipase
MKVYRDIESLPTGQTDENCITEGCLAVEGGGWRGLYAAGVIDGLMKADINLQTTVGVSAGALCGVAYVSGRSD